MLQAVPDLERAAADAAGVAVENAGLAVLTALRGYGVDTVFGIPGTHNLEFYRHLPRLGMRAVTSRHEQGAGYAADGWSQQTGLPGVVITTSGPGLLNALSAIGTAYCESRPLVVLSPGVARGAEFADVGTLHETKDASGAAGSIAEWSRRVESAEAAVAAVHDAFELFRTGRPRPVHIEIPLDVLEAACDLDEHLLAPRPTPGERVVDTGLLARVAAILGTAERPVIVAGGGSTRAAGPLRALAERLGAPVVTTLNGKGALDERHPLAVGAELRLESARRVVNAADALLVVGAKLGEAELWGGVIAPAGAVIRIDVLESQLHKNLAADLGLVGHADDVLARLVEALAGPERADTRVGASWVDLDAVRAECAVEARSFAPVTYDAAVAIASAIPHDAIVSGDSSQITYLGMSSTVRSTRPHAFLYMAAYATLGYGLPAAIGARVAEPRRPVVSVLGDGALMFSVQEFATAVEQGLDLTVVCVDNGGYREIEQNEHDRGIEPIGVRLVQPDWAALAEAFGAHGHRTTSRDEVGDVVARAIAEPGVSLVHVPLRLFSEAPD
ncbi:thiamine pyrophosphate-binding protein [Agromyces sp. NPDC058104]|uniref:thiamine pyrophosphate-binding protein n=1 Tax=Agromyces sp. NPDC058104 TaxID=3346342 RepID=UPI0036DB18A0